MCINTCIYTCSYMYRDKIVRVPWRIYMCHDTADGVTRVSLRLPCAHCTYKCAMAHVPMCHDAHMNMYKPAVTCMSLRIYTCSYVRRDTSARAMAHLYMPCAHSRWGNTQVTADFNMFICAHDHMCIVTHWYACHGAFISFP